MTRNVVDLNYEKKDRILHMYDKHQPTKVHLSGYEKLLILFFSEEIFFDSLCFSVFVFTSVKVNNDLLFQDLLIVRNFEYFLYCFVKIVSLFKYFETIAEFFLVFIKSSPF